MRDSEHLVMPKLGLTMQEGTIASWRVRPGQRFAAGEIVVVIETDKIANDVEAPAAGVLDEILHEEGASVPVSEPIARWHLEQAPVRAAVHAAAGSPAIHRLEQVDARAEAPRRDDERRSQEQHGAAPRRLATPYARRLARDLGVALVGLEGSGPNGRIKAQDVLRARQLAPDAPVENVNVADAGAQRVAADQAHAITPAPQRALRSKQDPAPRALSLAQTEIATAGLRQIEARLPPGEQQAVRLALIAMGCARAFPMAGGTVAVQLAEAEGLRALEVPQDGRPVLRELVAVLGAAMRNALDRPAARVTGGAILIIPAEPHIGLFAPAAPAGWPAALGVAAEQEKLRRLGTGEIESMGTQLLALSYDAAHIEDRDAMRFLATLKELLEEPLLLLAA